MFIIIAKNETLNSVLLSDRTLLIRSRECMNLYQFPGYVTLAFVTDDLDLPCDERTNKFWEA